MAKPAGGTTQNVLIIIGIVILAGIALRGLLSLVLWLGPVLRGGEWTGSFGSDILPTIILTVLGLLCIFGIYKLVPLLRK